MSRRKRSDEEVRSGLAERALGDADGELGNVAEDAEQHMAALLRCLPSRAEPVRAMAAIHSRHVALYVFYGATAEKAGLDTPRGLMLLEVADRQSLRAERTWATCLDVARLAAKKEGAELEEKLREIALAARSKRPGFTGPTF